MLLLPDFTATGMHANRTLLPAYVALRIRIELPARYRFGLHKSLGLL
jgi:hypothetical protein